MANVYFDNFDSYSAPTPLNTLGHWTASSGVEVDTSASAVSSPNALVDYDFSTEQYAYVSDTDGNNGNASASISGRMIGDAATVFHLCVRATVTPLATCYALRWTQTDVKLYYRTGGTDTTQIGSTISWTPGTTEKYTWKITASGTTISAQIQRISDGYWLQSGGTFAPILPVPGCISGTDGNISGAGKAGVLLFNSIDNTRLDNFSFDTTPAPISFSNFVQGKVVGFPVITTAGAGSTGSITGATNTTPIVITSTAHGLATGTVVTIASVGGNTNANATWPILVLTANTFALVGSSGNASYTSGGTWTVKGVAVTLDQSVTANNTLFAIIGTFNYPITVDVAGATNAAPIAITTGTNHGLSTGQTVQIVGVGGNTAANGTRTVHVTGATTFTLDGSDGTSSGAYTPNTGTVAPNNPVTDSIGNSSWQLMGNVAETGNNLLTAWWVYHSTSGQPTVTILPLAGSNGFVTVFLAELSGISQNTTDGYVKASGLNQSTNSPGTIPVSNSRDLVIAAFCQGSNNIDNATVNSSFSMLGFEPGGVAVESLGVAAKISGSNETPTFSTFETSSPQTVTWSGIGLSLQAVSSGGLATLLRTTRRSMLFPLNATSQSVDVNFVDDSGLPLTGKVAADFPTLTLSQAGAHSDTAVGSLSDLSTLTTAWSAGGVKERGNGVYRLDLPNAAFAAVGHWKLRGEATGKHVLCDVLDVVQFIGSDGRSNLGGFLDHTITESTAGNFASAMTHFFDVSPTARATINNVVITSDLASDYMRRQTAADFNFADSVPVAGIGSDKKFLISTDSQDLSASLSVNAKKIGGTNQTGFDIGLYATHAATMIELDPNSADPQNSLAASNYRFSSGSLHNQFKEIVNGMNAYDVFGQVDFFTDSGTVNQSTTGTVTGVAYDPVNNYLFEAEGSNHRILAFKADPSQPNKTAIHVLGQTNFTNHSANEGGSPTANSLSNPNGLWYDTATKFLWVADSGNHRVGYYDFSAGISDHQALARVLGQANKTSGSANRGSTTAAGTLNSPSSVCTNATLGWVAVTDSSNNRVCIWTAAITADGQSANVFLGQSSSTGNSAGSTQTTISQPQGVALDADNARIFAGDTGNARCMIWGSHVTTGGAADNVLGQPDFTTHNSGRRTRAGLYDPGPGFFYDSERNWLFIPEIGNFRVSVWDVAPATLVNGPLALYVLNQPSFVDEETALTANRTLVANNALVQDKANDRLFVGEQLSAGGRVKVFQLHNYLRRNQAVDFPNMTEPTAVTSVNGNMVTGISYIHATVVNKRLETGILQTLRNSTDTGNISTRSMSDDGTTLTVSAMT